MTARILVVDDVPANVRLLEAKLSIEYFEVLTASDGPSALKVAAAQAPDLILLDMSLPVIDGWEAARRLKAAPTTSVIPIIALTAHAMAGDREKALAAGCDDYDTKPVDFPQLLGKIDALLASRS